MNVYFFTVRTTILLLYFMTATSAESGLPGPAASSSETNSDERVIVHGESLNLTEAVERYDQNTRYVAFLHIGLTQIPANSFLNYSKLETLYLDINQISHIEDGAFNGLGMLWTLGLSSNNLTMIIPSLATKLKLLKKTFLLTWAV